MGEITFEQVPHVLGLILKKMEGLEEEIKGLKEKYESAPTLPNDHDELLTQPEAITFLKVSANTLHRWKRNGTIPYRKIGTRSYFKKSDLEEYNKTEIKKPKGLRRF